MARGNFHYQRLTASIKTEDTALHMQSNVSLFVHPIRLLHYTNRLKKLQINVYISKHNFFVHYCVTIPNTIHATGVFTGSIILHDYGTAKFYFTRWKQGRPPIKKREYVSPR